MEDNDITCIECKHSVDLIKSLDMVYCMKHQKRMFLFINL